MSDSFYVSGWVADPEAVEGVVAAQPFKSFSETEAGSAFSAKALPDHVYLWDAARKATGSLLPSRSQGTVGSCVSFGTVRAIEYTMVCEQASGKPEEFKDLATEVTYGGSRVEVGKGRLGRGDGSIGAWAAEFSKNWGVLARGVYGEYDLTKYSESVCRKFGASGVPDTLETEARKHPVKAITLVATWEEAKKALSSGYGISVCSGQGFSMKRDSNGISQSSGKWAHCMCICGYTTIDGKEYGRIDNSWGAKAHTGPTGPGEPGPEGFYADASVISRMLAEKDSWAFSSVEGFPVKSIDWFM